MIPDDLVTGHETIDAQHANLIAELELLKGVVNDGDVPSRRVVLEFLAFLRNHFVEHFGLEESLMSDVAYPGWPLHANEHLQFFDVFMHYRAKIEYGENIAEDSVALVAAVTNWVEQHVKQEDANFATYYRMAKEEEAKKGL